MASRRKQPQLPKDLFIPPPSSTSSQFPLSPDPFTVKPAAIVDTVIVQNAAEWTAWKDSAEGLFGIKPVDAVVSLEEGGDLLTLLEEPVNASKIIGVSTSFHLSSGPPSTIPAYLTSRKLPIALRTPITALTDELVAGAKWALETDSVRAVEIDVKGDLSPGGDGWEAIDGLVAKLRTDKKEKPIVISNLLPPPGSPEVPIIRVDQDDNYEALIGSLSLSSNVYLRVQPPSFWTDPVQKPGAKPTAELTPDEIKAERKRRVKTYLGPALDAFGYSRLIFTSPPSSSKSISIKDWYDIVRECIAESEYQGIDAVFGGNLRDVYLGSKE